MADPQAVRAAWRDLGQQLAARRKAAKLNQRDLADQTTYSRSSIANIEIGRQHVDRAFWEKADEQVCAGGELVRGYDAVEALHRAHQRRRTEPRTGQGERQAVNAFASGSYPSVPVGGADLAASAEDEPASFAISWGRDGYSAPLPRLADLSVDTPPPSAIGWNDVNQVRFVTRALAHSENTFGGGFSGEAAAAQLRYSALLLNARANNDVRRVMFEAVGNLGGVVGFSTFDAGKYQSAKICFEFELWCAEQAKSWELRASALSDLARLAIYLGEFDDALSLIELAQVRSERLTGATRAMLAALRARLLALSGRYDEAESELALSDEYFANRVPAASPPWMSYYDEAEHLGSTGRALVPIALRTSDPHRAAARMHRAIDLHDDGHPRSRALSRTRLASLVMRVGDPKEAVSAGRIALVEASSVRSARLRKELERLAAIAAPHTRIPEVSELVREITAPRRSNSVR